ncbi:hypothetical protein B0I37DRAFT_380785 [Chaetomium sp. MPI-CAGE-AT-0009]|nr:hypothetical protein B0I37DRAFT_380785 [Chaetomium sp. MPI-CAGE-AT-0009]
MSFGFSVGDFLAVIELVHDLAVALSDGRGSSVKFQGLVQELYSLERAMVEIKNLQVPAELEPRLWIVQQAGSHCQTAINNFLRKGDVYMRCLSQRGTAKWWKDAFYKIKWAVYKADDVDELRASLRGHSMAMGLMLQLLQIESVKDTMARVERQVQSQAQLDRSSLEQLASNLQADLMLGITNAMLEVTTKQTQSNADLGLIMMQTLQTTMQIHQMMSQAQTDIPGQVLRQQPVYLEDARGILAPFHLEFITSANILIYALKERYSESGARKVEQGKFAITDAKTLRDIDLTRDWKRCFRPGQRVNMSLFFRGTFTETTTCPSCHAECDGAQDEEIECQNCGMIFRRIEVIQPKRVDSVNNPDEQARNDSSGLFESAETRPSSASHLDDVDSPSEDEDDGTLDDEISEYKRIRLLDDGRIRRAEQMANERAAAHERELQLSNQLYQAQLDREKAANELLIKMRQYEQAVDRRRREREEATRQAKLMIGPRIQLKRTLPVKEAENRQLEREAAERSESVPGSGCVVM